MTYTALETWAVILGLGIGTYLIRFSFLGLVGERALSPFLLRLLRYTPVAVMPGLVAPLIMWPEATGGEPDAARLFAAGATLAVGVALRSVIWSILTGGVVLYAALAFFG